MWGGVVCLYRGGMSGLQINGDVWEQATINVLVVADNVGVAASAARSALSFNAFGVLCSPLLVPIYSNVESAALSMLSSAQTGLERAALGLRSGKQLITETVEDQARLIGSVSGSGGGSW